MSIPARVTLNCPDWCTADHRHGPDVDEYSDLVTHSREIGRVAIVNATAVVSVVATDVYERDGAGRLAPTRRTTPTVYVAGAEELTPAQTGELIAALTEASVVAQRLADETRPAEFTSDGRR